MSWKPQIFAGVVGLVVLGITTIFVAPEYVEIVVPAAITGIAALSMKLAEK